MARLDSKDIGNLIATFPAWSLQKVAEEKDIHLPSSKLTWQWKFTSNGGFSIAMLVYRRVFQGNLGYIREIS